MPTVNFSTIQMDNPIKTHRAETKRTAKSLKSKDIYHWLVQYGYFPENYVLPPCFFVSDHPKTMKQFFYFSRSSNPTIKECVKVQFPKSHLADRIFSIPHPEHHNDIAFHIAKNWKSISNKLLPENNDVVCYSFPIPINTRKLGRIGFVRSGRSIYEFLTMAEEDIVSVAFQYKYLVKADIKAFYPSIYTHSISWAAHSKSLIRKNSNRYNMTFYGNRLDKLFQYLNDQQTNGIPIGPVVSDIVAEMIAAAVDVELTKLVRKQGISCEMVRFKDDYRILVNSKTDGKSIIKSLQTALLTYNLELSESKTFISNIPEGLFRPWVSEYHTIHPCNLQNYSWKYFREWYLAVLRIDEQYPGVGVIDRFLADLHNKNGELKITLNDRNLRKTISMLIMLGRRRIKSFPKILAIIEAIVRSPVGMRNRQNVIEYLEEYFIDLSKDENSNRYLLSWLAYFFVSNDFKKQLKTKLIFKDPIVKTCFNNRSQIFKDSTEFKLFIPIKEISKKMTLLEYLDVFNPPLQE